MSGRFDGNHSTIGNMQKYTHRARLPWDARKCSVIWKVEGSARLASGNVQPCWIVLRLNPVPYHHRFSSQIGTHAGARLDGEHR
jgi:hypothetical protein